MIEVIRSIGKYTIAAICLVVAIVKSNLNQTPNFKKMKKLLFAIMLLASIQSIAQDKKDTTHIAKYLEQSGPGITMQGGALPLALSSTFTNSHIYFMGKDFSQNPILKITGEKEIWFKPSAFCSCDSCKRFTGMKFLMKF
jgi:hypothetical protein